MPVKLPVNSPNRIESTARSQGNGTGQGKCTGQGWQAGIRSVRSRQFSPCTRGEHISQCSRSAVTQLIIDIFSLVAYILAYTSAQKCKRSAPSLISPLTPTRAGRFIPTRLRSSLTITFTESPPKKFRTNPTKALPAHEFLYTRRVGQCASGKQAGTTSGTCLRRNLDLHAGGDSTPRNGACPYYLECRCWCRRQFRAQIAR